MVENQKIWCGISNLDNAIFRPSYFELRAINESRISTKTYNDPSIFGIKHKYGRFNPSFISDSDHSHLKTFAEYWL